MNTYLTNCHQHAELNRIFEGFVSYMLQTSQLPNPHLDGRQQLVIPVHFAKIMFPEAHGIITP